MNKNRLEAFSDGVFAIIITIMVLEMRPPQGASFGALRPLVSVFISYVLSFCYVGIYWTNHHHMLQATDRVSGPILWANLHLLFWLSLFPFVTAWSGENHFAAGPMALYGVVLLMAALAYYALCQLLIRHHGRDSALARAIGIDIKGIISPILYAAAIPLAFVNRWIAFGLYATVALMWIIPDRRIEKTLPATRPRALGVLVILLFAGSWTAWADFGIEVQAALEIRDAIMEHVRSVEVTFVPTEGQASTATVDRNSPSRLEYPYGPAKPAGMVYLGRITVPLQTTGTIKASVSTSEGNTVACEIPARRFPSSVRVYTYSHKPSKTLSCYISGNFQENVYQPF